MIPIGIYFGGAGGLFSYYLGIAKYIQENYDLNNVYLAGVSAGSIASIALSCELMTNNCLEEVIVPIMNEIRNSNKKKGSFLENSLIGCDWVDGLKVSLGNFIRKSGKFDLVNKKCYILVSKINFFKMEGEYISKWKTIDDLLDCMVTSCWIPILFGKITNTFRKTECIDGGACALLPEFTELPRENEIKWLKINLNSFRKFDSEGFSFILHSSLFSLSFCADEDYIEYLMNLGYEDAKNNKEFFKDLEKL